MKKIFIFLLAIFFIPQFSFAQNVGIGTDIPGSKLTVNGSFGAMYKPVSGVLPPILDSTDHYVSWIHTANGTVTLPSLRTVASNLNYRGRLYYIKNNTTQWMLTVTASGSERIDVQGGGAGVASISVSPGETVQLVSTGNVVATGISWEVVNHNLSNSPNINFWKLTGNTATNPASDFLGTTDAQPLIIRTNNSERIRVLNTGNVGIGTNNPAHLLQVSDMIANGTNTLFSILQPSLGTTSTTYMKLGKRANASGDNYNAADIAFYYDNNNSLQNRLAFGFHGFATDRMVIRADANVGINTTSPGSKLTVNGSFGAMYKPVSGALPAVLDSTDHYVSWTHSANGTVRLPSLRTVASNLNYRGRLYYIKNNTTQWTLTVTTSGSERIDVQGGVGVASISVSPGETVQLVSTGNTVATGISWEVVNHNLSNSPNVNFWRLAGNAGTNPASNFLGTTDAQPLIVRTNGIERLRITNTGAGNATGIVGIGITNPFGTHKLQLVDSLNLAVIFSAQQPLLAANGSTVMKLGRSTNIAGDNNNAADIAFYYNSNNSMQNRLGFGFHGTAADKMVIRADANVGINTTSPGSKLTVNGSFGAAYKTINGAAPVALDSMDHYISWSHSGNGTVTLPSVRSLASNLNYRGRLYYIKNNTTQWTLTVVPNGSERIDVQGGGVGVASISISPGETVQLVSTGSTTTNGISWEVVNQNITASPNVTFWKLTGNANTDAAINYIGTNDNRSLVFGAGTTNRWMHLTPGGLLRLSRNAHDTSGVSLTNKIRSRLLIQKDELEGEQADDYIFESYGNSYQTFPAAGETTQKLIFRRAAGNIASPSNLQPGDLVGEIVFDPYLASGGGFTGTGAKITSHFTRNGTFSPNVPMGDLKFYTSFANTGLPGIYIQSRMHIADNGNVGIGQENPRSKLRVSGSFSPGYVAIGGNVILDSNHYCISVSGTSTSGSTVQLPEVFPVLGTAQQDSRIYVIRNTNTSGFTAFIVPFLGQTINGLTDPLRLPPQYTATIMQNNTVGYDGGNDWNVLDISRYTFEEGPFIGEGGDIRIDDAEDHEAWHIDQYRNYLPPPAPPVPPANYNPRLRIYHEGGGEVVSMLENGRVGIGTPNPDQLLTVNGGASKPGSTAWSTFSDLRVKKNIQPYKAGLKEIIAIDPIVFQYNGKVYNGNDKSYVGVIAQEIEKILPGTVTKVDAEGIKDLRQFDGSELTYTLINAIKEQQKQIEELSIKAAKVEQMEQEIQSLKAEYKNFQKEVIKQMEEIKKNEEKK